MKLRFFAATAALCFAASMVFPAVASAAEIRVLCSMALKAVAEELFPQFEKEIGRAHV